MAKGGQVAVQRDSVMMSDSLGYSTEASANYAVSNTFAAYDGLPFGSFFN